MSRRGELHPRKPTHFRDAKLFLVAVEGALTEPDYFETLSRDVLRSPRIRVEVLSPLPTSSEGSSPQPAAPISERPGASAPQHVAKRLLQEAESRRRKQSALSFDQLWIVVDYDRWEHQIRQLAQDAQNQRFCLAVSRPAFELWLLLHYTNDLSEVDAATSTKAQQKACEDMLKRCVANYSKSRKVLPAEEITESGIRDAADRARQRDAEQGAPRWPEDLGSHVYKLIDALLETVKPIPAGHR